MDVSDASATSATVTACLVFNEVRVGAGDVPIGDTGVLSAARITQDVERTDLRWLPAGIVRVIWSNEGVTSCPPL